MRTTGFTTGLITLLPLLAAAQSTGSISESPQVQEQAQEWIRVEGDQVAIEIPAEMIGGEQAPTLYDLMLFTRDLTGIQFYVPNLGDERALQKELVVLYGAKRVPKVRFYDFFQVLLKLHEFACVEMGREPLSVVRIVRLQGPGMMAVKSNTRFVSPDEIERYADRPATLITTVIPLNHIDSQQATQMLSRFFTSQSLESFAPLGTGPRQKAGIMVVGFGPTVYAIHELLRSIDVPPEFDAQNSDQRHEVLLHCEIWSVPPGSLQQRVEKLSEMGSAGIPAIREIFAAGESCRRELRYLGPAAFGEEISFDSGTGGGAISRQVQQRPGMPTAPRSELPRRSGPGAALIAMCEQRAASAVTLEIALEVSSQSEDQRQPRRAELRCTTSIPFGQMRMIQTSGPEGGLVLVLLKVLEE